MNYYVHKNIQCRKGSLDVLNKWMLTNILHKNKEVHEYGVYVLEWSVDGVRAKKSTFFPKNWSRETVLNKIAEAYIYCEKHGIDFMPQKNGRLELKGYTSEGIHIKMVFEECGKLITAYVDLTI